MHRCMALSLTLALASFSLNDLHAYEQRTDRYKKDNQRNARQKRLKSEWEWTQYAFYDLYAELPNTTANAQKVYERVANTMKGNRALKAVKGKMREQLLKQLQMMNPATHESAHLLYINLYNDRIHNEVKKKHKNYGSFMYDWGDECSAVFCETETLKNNRRRQLEKTIPLKEFLVMTHPAIGPNGVEMPSASSPIARRFYAQSLAFSEYLRFSGGKPFYRFFMAQSANNVPYTYIFPQWNRLVKALVNNSTYKRNLKARSESLFPKSVIINGVRFLPGEMVKEIAPSFEEFEKGFKRWVSKEFPTHSEPLLVYRVPKK